MATLRPWQLLLGTVAIGVMVMFKELLPVRQYLRNAATPAAEAAIVSSTRTQGSASAGGMRVRAAAPTSGGGGDAHHGMVGSVSLPKEVQVLPLAPHDETLDSDRRFGISRQQFLDNVSDGGETDYSSSLKAGGATPFIAMGVVSNCMWQNSFERRRFIRDTWLTYPNVGKTMPVTFIIGMMQSDLARVPAKLATRLRAEASEHRDTLLLERVPERKSPCLKTMAWYRYAVRAYPTAAFISKTDDDAFVHTMKLEHNMRRFANEPLVYIGSTLWGSYITKTFEACARRMGPMMALGGMREEKCVERGAVGPYPYAVGMLQVLSHKLASWMVEQPEYEEFEMRATIATKPPMMDHGEDMVIGMFIYLSPWPLMPLHWGWDKLHDLCFKCERKDQIWRPITHQTVVAHHVANEEIMGNVFRNISQACDDRCVHTDLPFEVTSLADLCSRGQIASVYSKCAMVNNKQQTQVNADRGRTPTSDT